MSVLLATIFALILTDSAGQILHTTFELNRGPGFQ